MQQLIKSQTKIMFNEAYYMHRLCIESKFNNNSSNFNLGW